MKIEKNIPLPKGKHTQRYAIVHEMEVGDSFLVDDHVDRTMAVGYGNKIGRKENKRFVSRKVDGGYRVWRVK